MSRGEQLRIAAALGCFLLLCFMTPSVSKTISFKKNLLQGTTTKSSLKSWTTPSTEHCAQACAGLSKCRSFSVQSGTRECSLYSSRVFAPDIANSSESGPKTFYNMRTGECPVHKGYTLIPGTQKCVRFNRTPQEWTQAQSVCEAEEGHLLLIEDLNIWSAVRTFLEEEAPEIDRSINVGGFTSGSGQHLWLDGTPVAGGLWVPGEPQGGSCLSLWWAVRANNFAVLDDVYCDNDYYSVCEV